MTDEEQIAQLKAALEKSNNRLEDIEPIIAFFEKESIEGRTPLKDLRDVLIVYKKARILLNFGKWGLWLISAIAALFMAWETITEFMSQSIQLQSR